MKFLSSMFFIISPFALFCSEDGNGLILCPVFIMLGFVFKWIGNNTDGTSKPVVKIDPKKFWEWHYKDRMSSTFAQKDSTSEGLMALKDKEARSWATTICGYHNAWVPPEGRQEQIARENGVITERMIRDKDKLQFGKYYLLSREIEEKTQIAKSTYKENKSKIDECIESYMVIDIMKKCLELIEYSNGKIYFWLPSKLQKTFGANSESAVWATILSEDERAKSKMWFNECMKRIADERKVEKSHGKVLRDTEYQIKYGFKI